MGCLEKAQNQPVYKLIGATKEKVSIYGSGGWISYSIDELIGEVTDYASRGFKAVKIKVGSPKVSTDLERLRKVREAVGNDIDIMMDANQGMDLPSAIKLANGAKDLNINWFEEPVNHQDFQAYQILKNQTGISLAMGEREFGTLPLRELVTRNALDIWQTDTSIGKNSWYYAENWIPKSSGELIADLVDIVSKNGCLLLNIGPKYDGTTPEDQQRTLREMGTWLKINGEAIYGSTYWETFGEGPTKTNLGHLSEDKNEKFTPEDIRFTQNKGNVYATVLVPPTDDKISIRYLNTLNIKIKAVKLLGYKGEIKFNQTNDKLIIDTPHDALLEHSWVFKIVKE